MIKGNGFFIPTEIGDFHPTLSGDYRPTLTTVFFASANSQKLQAKMEKFASPFWRKLQAVRHSSSSTADMLLS